MAVEKPRGARTSRYSTLSGNKASSPKASWEDASAEDLWRTIYMVVNLGDAIMFSRTRDGGAVVLTLLSGDDRDRAYASSEEEIAEALRAIREVVEQSQ